MAFCVYCGSENITDAAFCSSCGKPIAGPKAVPSEQEALVAAQQEPQPETAAPQPEPDTPPVVSAPEPAPAPSTPDPAPAQPPVVTQAVAAAAVEVPAADTFKKAKRPLFRRPLAKDWTFWLFAAVAAIGSVQTVYRTGSNYAGWSTWAILTGGALDIVFPLAFSFLVFAIVPAFIRKLVFMPRDKKALREAPADLAPAWHPDPLKLAEHRWWDGTQWTKATAPQSSKKARWVAPLVVILIVIEMLIVFAAGLATGTANGGSGSGGSSGQSNAALIVNASFLGLAESVQKYNNIKVDMNAPLANIAEVKTAFDEVETNYIELSGSLPAVKSQSELGFGAPNIDKLKALVVALGPWIQTRKDYYAGLESCGPLTDGRQPTACDQTVFSQSEKPMVDSIGPVATAWQAVIDSMPKSNN